MRSVTPTRHHFQGERGNRTLATTFTVSGAATTPNSPSCVRRDSQPRMYMRGFAFFEKRKRRESNPHRPTGRPRLADACDEAGIRLSSRSSRQWAVVSRQRKAHIPFLPSAFILPPFPSCPRQELNLDFELRTLAWSPFHHGDFCRLSCLLPTAHSFTCLRQDSNLEHSVRSAA